MRRRLTYADVVSTIALFLAMSGGVVFAAAKIGTRDIQPDAVETGKIAPRAVTAKRLAEGAVRGKQLGRRAVGSRAIAREAVTPGKMAFPVYFVTEASGGSAPVTSGPTDYPIADNTWEQRPGEINVVFGEAMATLAYDGSGSGSCEVYFDIRENGQQVGGGNLRTDSTSPTEVTSGLGAQPSIDPETPVTNELTMRIGSNGDCTPDSTIDSTRFRVLDFG